MQVGRIHQQGVVCFLSVSVLLIAGTAAWVDEGALLQRPQAEAASHERSCRASNQDSVRAEQFDGVQIEASDLVLYEQFFESILRAPLVQRIDHPQVDRLRGYCYRNVFVVVRQDFRTPRPTGWVQLNFTVLSVATVQEELERAYRASSVYLLGEEARAKIVRFRVKPDVMRGDRRVARLEVAGPEGFMIGFDQEK
ncbi:MAG: hypothetical protein LZF86_80105 [Nitrospira sp.]|nr:MAG: hypothetical protein LZF86_80105 [Nitrospira sp.]